jgi:hypothetical protein
MGRFKRQNLATGVFRNNKKGGVLSSHITQHNMITPYDKTRWSHYIFCGNCTKFTRWQHFRLHDNMIKNDNKWHVTVSEVGSAIFFGGALSLECYLFFTSASASSQRFHICQCAKRYSAIAEASARHYPPPTPQIIERSIKDIGIRGPVR